MSQTTAYLALMTGVLVWALLVRKLRAKPWEAIVAVDDPSVADEVRAPAARVGLRVFLAVVSSLFALFMTAYYMRMGHGHAHGEVHDWQPLVEPTVLWWNTGLLIFGSVAMQWARNSVARGQSDQAWNALLMGGLLTLAFLAGQLFAWRELHSAPTFTPRNPALAFFYVLTAVHGLHLLGGLVVWARTLLRLRRTETELIDIRLSIELCAVYWHYLLLVWLAVFALLLAT